MSISNKQEGIDTLNVIVQAWDMVTPRTISRCFRKAGFSNVAALTPEEEDLPLSELAIMLHTNGLETTGIATVDVLCRISRQRIS